jgi:hypothetical protein
MARPREGAEACGRQCDARRLSTGRSIRAWRTLCGRQMTRNAGRALASEALVPWLGGPRSRGRSKRLLRSRRRVGRIAGGCAARPLRWCKKEGNGRLRRVGTEGVFALRARPHATGTMHDTPFEHFAAAHGDMREVRDPRQPISRQKSDNTRQRWGSVGGLGQCHGALQASFGPSTKPRFKAHDDHPLALQLEGAVGLRHQHLDDGAGAPVAERVELAVGERNGRGGPLWACRVRRRGGLIRHCRPPWRAHANSPPQLWTHAVVRATMRRRVRGVPPAPFILRQKKRTGGEGASE